MSLTALFIIIAVLAAGGYFLSRRRVIKSVKEIKDLNSLPGHYGWYSAALVFVPAALFIFLWVAAGETLTDSLVLAQAEETMTFSTVAEEQLFLNDVHNTIAGETFGSEPGQAVKETAEYHTYIKNLGRWGVALVAFLMAMAGGYIGYKNSHKTFRARYKIEKYVTALLIVCSVIAILTTLGIVLSLLFESLRFFKEVPLHEFLFGLQWSPQTALRADQVGSSGAFGAVPLFAGTFLISLIAMIVAVPIGLMAAIYMTQYARASVRKIAKPALEVLAGVPTVVFGFFAALTVAPFVRETGITLGLDVASESALAAGFVMGVMIIPLMSSLSDDAITAVPEALRDGSLAMGATRSETIKRVLIPAALPGIMGAFLLSISRAIGETMIVVMAAGLAANLTANPLEAVTAITAQIVALLTGDQEFDSAKTLSAFALGLVLFVMTLVLNIIALSVVRRFKEAYE